jgi:hypothetical protein
MQSVGVKAERGRRRLAVWFLVVPVLLLFSASLVGNALASRSSMEAKAGDLIPAGDGAADGFLVKFVADGDDGVASKVKSVFGMAHMKHLCWVTPATAAVLSQQYETREHRVTLPGRGTFGVLIVFDGDADSIRAVLDQGRCTLISDPWRTFYLPFQPHIS